MCNACGNVCCGSDQFGGCGCESCDNDECLAPCFNCGLIICDGDCQDEFDDWIDEIDAAIEAGGHR